MRTRSIGTLLVLRVTAGVVTSSSGSKKTPGTLMFDVSGTKLEELFVKIVAESKAKGSRTRSLVRLPF
jgi:hypothetical protein